MKALKWLDEHFEEVFLVIFLILITCVSMLQVISRTFAKSLPWPEEFCRLCWIATVFLSLPYTIRKGNILRVTVVADLLPTMVRSTLNIIIDLVIAGMMALFFNYSLDVIGSLYSIGRTSAAMSLPMYLLYNVTLIGFGLGALRSIQQAVIHIKNFNKKEMSTLEMAIQEAADEAASAQGAEGGSEET